MTDHQTTMTKINISYGLFTVIGAMWFASDFGASGVAGATALALALQDISVLLITRRKTGIWTHVQFARPSIRQIS